VARFLIVVFIVYIDSLVIVVSVFIQWLALANMFLILSHG